MRNMGASELRLKQSLRQQLERFCPADEAEVAVAKQLSQFLNVSRRPFDRENLTAHVVVDAWIVDVAARQVLLMKHAATGSIVTPGGHCEGDSDILEAALREATEETGLRRLLPLSHGVFDLDTGWMPARIRMGALEPPHLHFHVCFAFGADSREILSANEEAIRMNWVPEISAGQIMSAHFRRIEKSILLQ